MKLLHGLQGERSARLEITCLLCALLSCSFPPQMSRFFLSNPRLHDAQKTVRQISGLIQFRQKLKASHVSVWNLTLGISRIITHQRPSSTEWDHRGIQLQCLALCFLHGAFQPFDLETWWTSHLKQLKVQHQRFQIVSNTRKNRSNNPFSKAKKTWLLAQPLWPWTPKRNVPSHYTGKIWNEDTSMVTLPKKGTGWIHAILLSQVRPV